jgi:hypothetical protein
MLSRKTAKSHDPHATQQKLSIFLFCQLMLIGNRFRPSGALTRSLKLEAVIFMLRRCQIGL